MRQGDILGGRYRIEALLGRGGGGSVYRAVDLRSEREVAIKLLEIRDLEDADDLRRARERFRREAEAGARLVHPNIVAVLDVGETAARTPFLALELAVGATLAETRSTRSLTVQERVGWLLDIARATVAAHRLGIVHRDLKPSNIIITRSGAKVLDFGIARVAGFATMTAEGFQPGTLRYMAPEQRRGDRVDARADQYAWGLIAHELFTGDIPDRSPFDDGRGDTPPALVPIITRAVERAPERRFATMEELLAALEPVHRQTTAGDPRDRRSSKRRGRPFLFGVLGTLVFGGVAGAMIARRSVDVAPSSPAATGSVVSPSPVETPSPVTSASASSATLAVEAPSGSAVPSRRPPLVRTLAWVELGHFLDPDAWIAKHQTALLACDQASRCPPTVGYAVVFDEASVSVGPRSSCDPGPQLLACAKRVLASAPLASYCAKADCEGRPHESCPHLPCTITVLFKPRRAPP